MIVTETSKSVVALDPANGKLLWQTRLRPRAWPYNAANPIVEGATVILQRPGLGPRHQSRENREARRHLCCQGLWSNTDNAVQFNTPVLKKGLLYGLTGPRQLVLH